MKNFAKKTLAVVLLIAVMQPAVHARSAFGRAIADVVGEEMQPGSVIVPAVGNIEVAFSPDEGAQQLVIKAIDSSRQTIRMLTYSFTSGPITQALLRAKRRGVDVAMVVDFKNNISEDRSGKAKAALGALATAGVLVRTINRFPIHHDKTMCIDGITVETGSFNYSDAAAHRNSEHVMVLWNNPKLTFIYLKHFDRNWQQSDAFQTGF